MFKINNFEQSKNRLMIRKVILLVITYNCIDEY